ncbi:pyruvate-flavodoxin oxidoreductase [Nostocoides sp. F2B08]|uniref:2-oxoacid:acceptor oxidoreductase family protein n=1 Tax=Nostocoides sp. F2B08 TaxID=2653936 RepID=UPI001263C4DD|nr:2-oxoacid:acceptor oxidoreductase family protein [Tetrasphaera sp. F2B08]KAB7744133.1 pyruvate-flavodoxin oxidoreductase [Tetrasphaera sp. F2B08]
MTATPQTPTPPAYPGIPAVIHGNGAVAHVMSHVCGGVIGYPITPSTEIAELFEAARAEGRVNVWGKHPFFFEPEGEHSAQSGALGAALTGGQYVSNASSSQGILYAMESHYVTVGKKVGGFVLQVAARVVSKHSLNVMAGHDDIYALLSSGYTIIVGSNPQEAADLAAISYRTAALSLIPVANAMDGFSTSHMLSEARLPEPELLRDYLGDPAGRIPCPTVAQEILFGAKGRVFQLRGFLERHRRDVLDSDIADLHAFLDARADDVERDTAGELVDLTLAWVPEELHGPWRRQWVNAHTKGTRQLVPALVDVHNPGLTGPVQNQPDFQAGAVDHRTHFASAVPSLVRQAMTEYAVLTGREYAPVLAYDCDDADVVMVGLGSVGDDVRAVLPHLRANGIKAGLASVKLLQPFPEAELVDAVKGAKALIVLERSDQTALTQVVTTALFKARENAAVGEQRHPGIPPLTDTPRLTTAIFGLGGHDLQPRHLIAAFEQAHADTLPPLVYLGSQFFTDDPGSESLASLQERLRTAYPETQLMGLRTGPNPRLLPEDALRIRFHSVGGYGTIATGKLLTDILAGVLGMHSKSAPKYGSEKSGAPTNYYITLSPEPILLTNAELEEVEVVIAPDHKAFVHTNPLKGLVDGGTFILQTNLSPEQLWRELPRYARRTIRDKHIRFFTIDAFEVARRHAPTPDLETRMMGIAFIGSVAANVDRVAHGAPREDILEKVRAQLEKKFGRKGADVVASNMAVVADGIEATVRVDYDAPAIVAIDEGPAERTQLLTVAMSASMCPSTTAERTSGLFDPAYYEDLMARPFREGTIAEAPVLPGAGLFMPPGTGAAKDKGLFRRTVPQFDPSICTGCLDCALVCPDAAIPNTVHEVHDLILAAIEKTEATAGQKDSLRAAVYGIAERTREALRRRVDQPFHEIVATAAAPAATDAVMAKVVERLVATLATYPVARTRPFFDSPEKDEPGTGGLFAATVDPWKCTGCLECVEVCGPGALTSIDQDADILSGLQERFAFMTALPNTPDRFVEGSDEPDGDIKRLMLDHDNFYATTGGHGGCRGCGEVTAIRLVMSTSHALGERRRRAQLSELMALVDRLYAKRATVDDEDRKTRISGAITALERRLYLLEGGPTGNGPASTIIANSTGCSSVYASTMPFTNYLDPWVNSLFQDAQPLAKGIFEGLAAQHVDDVRALRTAELELSDAYDPDVHDRQLTRLGWGDFTDTEMRLLPTVLTIGGDGASYDIGFGAMSRILASDTPIKVLVLNSGAYSNTGGQTSTASLTAQDSDLARFGSAHDGKHESRKELGLIASFHPNVYVAATSTAIQGHFLKTAMEFLQFQEAAAVLDVYTPCGSEHGISEDASANRARLAVESRMNPVFVHDPRRGSTLHDWFVLDGNPEPKETWAKTDLAYRDEAGDLQLMRLPVTPAEFALGETRFRKQFHRLPIEFEDVAVPMDEYVELSLEEQAAKVPFIYATDADQHLLKVRCSGAIVALVKERRRYWQTLQWLAGVHEASLTALHRSDLEDLRAKYEQALRDREASIDDIANAMSSLATSSRAPAGLGSAVPVRTAGGMRGAPTTATSPPGGVGAAGAATAAAEPMVGATGAAPAGAPVWLAESDIPKCNDCGTCYQELPQLFESTTMVIDGAAQKVARMIPGALESVELTPELLKRVDRVKKTCDAEIIQ